MASRNDLLKSIRKGHRLRAIPNSTIPDRVPQGRPRMTLMQQMQAALQRRRRIQTGNRPPIGRPTLNENDIIWYYVSSDGSTVGPVSVNQLKPLYGVSINENTYVWNGTTVSQWTQMKTLHDLYHQVKGKMGKAIHVWYCLNCKIYDNTPLICSRTLSHCKGATVLKPKCANCNKLAVENKCDHCKRTLNIEASRKVAHAKEDKRQKELFLRACNNFNTNDDNIMLFLYGFVHEMQDINLYDNVPIEMMEFIAAFWFNMTLLKEYNDLFDIHAKSTVAAAWRRDTRTVVAKHMKFSDNGEECWLASKVDEKQVVYGADAVDLSKDITRKLWKLQIMQHSVTDQHIEKDNDDEIYLSIGIANRHTINETMYCVKIRNLAIGDVIDMLYIVDEGTDNSTLSFAVNGRSNNISIAEIPLEKYKLVIVLRNPLKIKILH